MHVVLLSAAGTTLLLDQLTKRLVVRYLAGRPAPVRSKIRIRYVENAGQTWSVLRTRIPLVLLWVFVLGTIVLAMHHGIYFRRFAAQVGLGAALGGAGSNLYDRQRRGLVVDFLDIGWWPVFNLADLAITVGVILALLFFR